MVWQPCWMTERFVLSSNMAAMPLSFLISRDCLQTKNGGGWVGYGIGALNDTPGREGGKWGSYLTEGAFRIILIIIEIKVKAEKNKSRQAYSSYKTDNDYKKKCINFQYSGYIDLFRSY